MPAFGTTSTNNLNESHPLLQELFNEVIKEFDCSVTVGARGEAKQNELFLAGKTQVQFPDSKHNQIPSMALDVAPYDSSVPGGVDWADRDRFHYFAGFVKGTAIRLGIKIRWGGDWDSDWQTKDNNFDDLVHFELLSTEKITTTSIADSIAVLSERIKAKDAELAKANQKIKDIENIIIK